MKTITTTPTVAPFSQEKGLMSKMLTSVIMLAIALFLTTSLSGCFDDGAKTASQSSDAASAIVDSGKIKLVLSPGAREIYMHFSARDVAEKQSKVVLGLLREKGIAVDHSVVSGDRSVGNLFIKIGSLQARVVVLLEKNELDYFTVASLSGTVAHWEPSFGDEAKYS